LTACCCQNRHFEAKKWTFCNGFKRTFLGNGDYDLLLSKIFKLTATAIIIRYFKKYSTYSIIFVVIFVLQVSHLLPHLFCKILANTKVPNLFRVEFKYENKIVSSFAKQESPEIKSFRIALAIGHLKVLFVKL